MPCLFDGVRALDDLQSPGVDLRATPGVALDAAFALAGGLGGVGREAVGFHFAKVVI